MAPVRFCSETERAQLFQEFLHEPGVWESLLQVPFISIDDVQSILIL